MSNGKDKIDDILNEPDPLKQSAALNHLTIDILKQNEKTQRIQWIIMGILVGFCVIMMLFMTYDNIRMRQEVVESIKTYQQDFLEFMRDFDYAVEETTTTTTETTTQEVSGDNAEINNVSGNQYKDSATHNQGEQGGDE